MNKYIKRALVLIYLVQVLLIFRESIVHLYKSVIEAGHSQTIGSDESGHLNFMLKRSMMPGVTPHEQVASGFMTDRLLALLGHAIMSEHDEIHHPHHSHDEKEDREKKSKRKRQYTYVIADLFHALRKMCPTAENEIGGMIMVPRFIAFAPSSV